MCPMISFGVSPAMLMGAMSGQAGTMGRPGHAGSGNAGGGSGLAGMGMNVGPMIQTYLMKVSIPPVIFENAIIFTCIFRLIKILKFY